MDYLLTIADRVKVIKTDRGRTLYSIPLYKLYISIITAKDSKVEIYKYSDINLAIKVGK